MRNALRTSLLLLASLLAMVLHAQPITIQVANDSAATNLTPRLLWEEQVSVAGLGREVPGIDLLEDDFARYRIGDDPTYAQRDYVDTAWVEPDDSSDVSVPGATVHWLRFHLYPAEGLKGMPLRLNVQARGPFTLFLNGTQLLQSAAMANSKGELPASDSVPRISVPLNLRNDGAMEILALRLETPPGGMLDSTALQVSLQAGNSTYHLHRILVNYGVFIGINAIIMLMALLIGWAERRDKSWLLLAGLSFVSVLDTFCELGGSMGVLGLPTDMANVMRLLRIITVPWSMYLLLLVLSELRGGLRTRLARAYTIGIGVITLIGLVAVAVAPGIMLQQQFSFTNDASSRHVALLVASGLVALAIVGFILAWFAIEQVRLGIRLWRSKGYERWVGVGAVTASLLTIPLAIAGSYSELGLSSWMSLLADYFSFVAVPLSVAIYLSIRSGHHTRLVTRQRDELDQEVQDRTAELRAEKERSDDLLLNILPHEVAEELKNTGAAVAKHFNQATVLFSDFRGFTQLSEKLSPEELVREIDTCFKHFDGLMDKWRMEKIKTIGDSYMAAGGLPDPTKGSPADVVRAALDMQDFMRQHAAHRSAQGLPVFQMRVGIHTGPVVAGIVGVKKFQYDIWGDTVNTASRMESSGEVGQVNISGATYALVKDAVVSSQLSVVSGPHGSRTTDNQQRTTAKAFTFTPRGMVQAKGKGEMEMYFVSRSLGEG